MKEYNFGEKVAEWSPKQKKEVPVWVTPKYTKTREKAVETVEKYDDVFPEDFWILMNETKNGKMAYTGLIISHNGCLKINDHLPQEDKFRPECITVNEYGYGDSLVFTYICPEQGIYEVGEVSKDNCRNAYPYAMALKRCMDRVILKSCKLAYSGVYSDSEADEFSQRLEEEGEVNRHQLAKDLLVAGAKHGFDSKKICDMLKVNSLTELSDERLKKGVEYFERLEAE